jgi:hypothetical protein
MNRTTSLLSQLFLFSLLLWGVAAAEAEEPVVKETASWSFYCHMQSPEMRTDTLSWDHPVLGTTAGNIVDFYGPCDRDPVGPDAVKAERRALMREIYGDGE